MKMNKNNAGLEAEKLAATFLANHGLKLVTQNYHSKYGEIDLMMKDANPLYLLRLDLGQTVNLAAQALALHRKNSKNLFNRTTLSTTIWQLPMPICRHING
jgi:putative endonuclease